MHFFQRKTRTKASDPALLPNTIVQEIYFKYKDGPYSSQVCLTSAILGCVNSVSFTSKSTPGMEKFNLEEEFGKAIDECRNSHDRANYSIRCIEKEDKTFFINSNPESTLLSKAVSKFLKTHSQNVTVDSVKTQTAFRTLINFSVPIFSKKTEVKDFRNAIAAHLYTYQQEGVKFCVFKKDPQRFEAIETINSTLKAILQKEALEKPDVELILRTIINAKKAVETSHRQGMAGKIGFTKSRLAEQLNQLLQSLVTQNLVNQHEIDAIEVQEKNKRRSSLLL